MKKLVLLITIGISLNLNAQNNSKQKELGIVFSNLNNFGIAFKLGKQKAMWRFSSVQISGNDAKTDDARTDIDNTNSIDEVSSFGFRVGAGREYRKLINDKFELRYGFDLFFGYNKSVRESEVNYSNPNSTFVKNDIESSYSDYGFNAVLGFNYIHNNLVFGAELQPFISIEEGEISRDISRNVNGSFEKEERNETSNNTNYGLNNGFALLSISYRF